MACVFRRIGSMLLFVVSTHLEVFSVVDKLSRDVTTKSHGQMGSGTVTGIISSSGTDSSYMVSLMHIVEL